MTWFPLLFRQFAWFYYLIITSFLISLILVLGDAIELGFNNCSMLIFF